MPKPPFRFVVALSALLALPLGCGQKEGGPTDAFPPATPAAGSPSPGTASPEAPASPAAGESPAASGGLPTGYLESKSPARGTRVIYTRQRLAFTYPKTWKASSGPGGSLVLTSGKTSVRVWDFAVGNSTIEAELKKTVAGLVESRFDVKVVKTGKQQVAGRPAVTQQVDLLDWDTGKPVERLSIYVVKLESEVLAFVFRAPVAGFQQVLPQAEQMLNSLEFNVKSPPPPPPAPGEGSPQASSPSPGASPEAASPAAASPEAGTPSPEQTP